MRLPFLAPPPAHAERRARIRDEAWIRLRSHVEWANYAWNGFVFAAAARDVAALRERLRVMLELRRERLEVFLPPTPGELASSLPAVLAAAESGSSVWVECFELDDRGARDEPWTRAWLQLLARANELRDRLRGGSKGGVLFVGLSLLVNDVRAVAPDLWSARGFTLYVPASPRSAEALPQLTFPDALFPSSALDQVIAELDRLGPAPTAARFGLLVRAAAAACALGRSELASALAKEAREIGSPGGIDVLLLAVEALLALADGDLSDARAKIDAALEHVSARLGRPASPSAGDGSSLARASGVLRDDLRVLAAELTIHLREPEAAAARIHALVADAEARDPDTDLPAVLRVLERAGRAHLQQDDLGHAEAFLRTAEQRLEQPRNEWERVRWESLRNGTRHASILEALACTFFAQGREAEARATARRARSMGYALAAQLGSAVTLLRVEWPEPTLTMEERENHRTALEEIAAHAARLVEQGVAAVDHQKPWNADLSMTAAATFDAMLVLADAEFGGRARGELLERSSIVSFVDAVAARYPTWSWTLRRVVARLISARRFDDHVELQWIDQATELCDTFDERPILEGRRTTWCALAGVAWAHAKEAWPPQSARSRAAVAAVLADAPSELDHRDAFTDVLLAMIHRFHDAYTTPLAIACASKGVDWATAFAIAPDAKLEDFERAQRFFQLWAEAYSGSDESRRTGIQILREGMAWAQTHCTSQQCDASIELARTELRLAEFLRASRDSYAAQVAAQSSAARARKLTSSSLAAHEILSRALAVAGGHGTADRDAELLSQACDAAIAWVQADPWSAGADGAALDEHWRRHEMPAAEWCAQLHNELALTTDDPALASALRQRGWELHDTVRRVVRGS
jgi:hypothetical protein